MFLQNNFNGDEYLKHGTVLKLQLARQSILFHDLPPVSPWLERCFSSYRLNRELRLGCCLP